MRMNNREKVLLMLMVLVITAWLSFTYIIEDQLLQLSDNEIELKIKKAELEDLKLLILEEPEVDRKIEEAYRAIELVAGTYFNTTPQEERILLLTDLLAMPFVQESSISFYEPEVVDYNGIDFVKDSVNITLSGQYLPFLNMLRTIWNFPKVMEVSNLTLSESGFDEVSGSITLDFYTFAAESDVVDDLYKWYIDETYIRDNPFEAVEDNGIIVRYLYLKDEELFNYSKYFQFTDIEGHFMEDEINEFLDYGYLYLNPYLTFEPDEPITRGEFIVLLDSVYQWDTPYDDEVDLTEFRDYDDLGSLEGSFAKAVYKGFLSGFIEGFEDRTLRPRDPISYIEVEYLMRRVKEDESFNWPAIANSFKWRKNVDDPRWDDLTQSLTRAEAVYLLYYYK